jgi:cysteinyl-tRNA synthetase
VSLLHIAMCVKVTEHMDAICDYIRQLLACGAAYRVESADGNNSGVYFSVQFIGKGKILPYFPSILLYSSAHSYCMQQQYVHHRHAILSF